MAGDAHGTAPDTSLARGPLMAHGHPIWRVPVFHKKRIRLELDIVRVELTRNVAATLEQPIEVVEQKVRDDTAATIFELNDIDSAGPHRDPEFGHDQVVGILSVDIQDVDMAGPVGAHVVIAGDHAAVPHDFDVRDKLTENAAVLARSWAAMNDDFAASVSHPAVVDHDPVEGADLLFQNPRRLRKNLEDVDFTAREVVVSVAGPVADICPDIKADGGVQRSKPLDQPELAVFLKPAGVGHGTSVASHTKLHKLPGETNRRRAPGSGPIRDIFACRRAMALADKPRGDGSRRPLTG